MTNEKTKRWLDTGNFRTAPTGTVDHERGIIEGISLCTVGEAKGHGVNLDAEFVDSVTTQGAGLNKGLKARFGHPNMCSTALGTFIGRFKNFRTVGEQAKADLFLSSEAKDTPHGDLWSYTLGMAENEPDMFGSSIVFTPGREYVRGQDGEKVYDFQTLMQATEDKEPIFVEMDTLHAADLVDEPAANNGLFSAFANETIAGQITEFLDLHPQIFEALRTNPDIIEALAQYGTKIDEFINRYQEYNENKNKGITMRSEEQEIVELESAEETTEETTDLTETPEGAEAAEEAEATEEPTEAAEVEQVDEGTEEEPEAMESNDIDREEFTRAVEDFGLSAAQAFAEGGGYAEAQKAYIAALETENAELKINKTEGVKPVEFTETEKVREKRDILRNL